MSRSSARLLALLLICVAVTLSVVIATTAGPSQAASRASSPAPAPSATPPLRLLVKGGSMTLLSDPGQSKDLFSGGAVPLALAAASLRLTDDAFRFAFPLRVASLNPVSLAASVSLRGGFVMWGRQTMSAWTVLSFTGLRVTLDTKATVSAVFDSTLGRHTITVLDLSQKHVSRFTTRGRHWVRIANIGATMSDWLVHQLTLAFPGYLPVSHTLGTITLTLRLN